MLGSLDRQRLFAFLFQKSWKPAEICGFRDIRPVPPLTRGEAESPPTPSNRTREPRESPRCGAPAPKFRLENQPLGDSTDGFERQDDSNPRIVPLSDNQTA